MDLTTEEFVKDILNTGSVLAMILSWTAYHSISWALLHSFFGWFYVIYYCIKFNK